MQRVLLYSTMKNKLIAIGVLLYLISPLKILSQNSQLTVFNNSRSIGVNYLTQSAYEVKEYAFPNKISSFYVDTISGFATILLQGHDGSGVNNDQTGRFIVYDINEKAVKWNKEINYNKERVSFSDGILLHQLAKKTINLDVESGEAIWKSNSRILFTDSKDNVGLGCKKGRPDVLQGVDLNTGQVLWEKMIKAPLGLNNIISLNDSILLIEAEGIHILNLYSGEGWGYVVSVHAKKVAEMLAVNMAGIFVGALTGTAFYKTGYDVLLGLSSNALIDKGKVYFASKNDLGCIREESGEIAWEYSFPNKVLSNSVIYNGDSVVYLINKGYAYLNGEIPMRYGTPFIAAFSKEDGKQQFITYLSDADIQIKDAFYSDDRILFLLNNKIVHYSLKEGQLINERAYNADKVGMFFGFFDTENWYVKNQDKYMRLSSLYEYPMHVYTDTDEIMVVSDELHLEDSYNFSSLYKQYYATDSIVIVGKDNDVIVLNGKGEKKGELISFGTPYQIGEKIYSVKDNLLYEVNLADL